MGTRTLLNQIPRPAQPRMQRIAPIDVPLLLVIIALCVFGLLMLYSASWDFSLIQFDSPTRMFQRQLAWMAIGTLVAAGLSRLDYHLWHRLTLPAMVGAIGLLLLVLLLGNPDDESARALLNGSVQPAEFAKLATVIYLAVWLHSKRQQLHDIHLGLIPLAVIIGFIGGLIIIQPDLSAAGTILVLGGLLFFLAGGDLKQILLLFIVALVVGAIVVQFSSTGQNRLAEYWRGIRDPLQASYHVRRSFEAVVRGGWFGVGIGRANTKYTGLPLAPTDSIFAVIAEELGLIGSVLLICMYGIFVWRGLKIASRAPDMLGSLLAAGLTYWIGIEAAINISVMVGLFPFAGNALPFISAGGSSLISTLAGIGILMNISRQAGKAAVPDEEENWRTLNATIDLRRRNGGRSVSRPGRS